MLLQALCDCIQEFSKLSDFAKEFAKLQEAFETTALEKSDMSCFHHLPAPLTKPTGVREDHVLSCRLELVDRAIEDGRISDSQHQLKKSHWV